MGMSVGNKGVRRGRFARAPMSEINVTPVVDVMLVLLIVFMVAAPLLTVGVPVDLPKTAAAPISGDNEPLTITLNGQGEIFVQETPSQLDAMVEQLLAIADNGYEQRIFVRADGSLPYSEVMRVMGVISSSGFTRVALVTESEIKPASKPGNR
ncbi:ExbD/TolR family protein [Parvibaculum sp.]|uniref:ExbD/TolR family protein n=1 Tax=Parvibaculum sp. TaxID=2024848 RepID=UPI001D644EBE|nr:ExbD/TolR family protein [Parvibaculum sp.]MBX3488991.1 ExbD/TolR family protein [Parvibaculum sp.]MCW5727140.1 ExbD/TolR family protein [Parvibaculum sp.]